MKWHIIAGLFIIALIGSLILALNPPPLVCDGENSCDIVKTSPYAKTFGIYNAYYGLVLFTLILLIIFAHIKKPTKNKNILLIAGIICSSLIALRFIYLQAVVLKVWCKYCLLVDITVLGTLFALIFIKERNYIK